MATRAELLRPGFKGLGAISTELETGAAKGAAFGLSTALAGAFTEGAVVFGNGLTTGLAELAATEGLADMFLLAKEAAGLDAFSRAGFGAGWELVLAAGTAANLAAPAESTEGLTAVLAADFTKFETGTGLAFAVFLAADLTTVFATAASPDLTAGLALADIVVLFACTFTMCLLWKAVSGQNPENFPTRRLIRRPALAVSSIPGMSADAVHAANYPPGETGEPGFQASGALLSPACPAGFPIQFSGYFGRRAIVAAGQSHAGPKKITVGESRQT